MSIEETLQTQLDKRNRLGNMRSLKITEKQRIDFASNDYLGLARSKVLMSLILQEWDQFKEKTEWNGFGSTGSRLLTGNTSYAHELENRIAQFHGYEAGLLFSCGYMANVGLISSIAREEDVLFFDAHIHASTQEGIRLSRVNAYPFRHNNVEHLETRLKTTKGKGKRFVCIESVYSIDGTIAPIEEIVTLCKMHGAELIVDEAHAVGVFGKKGEGLVAEKKIQSSVFAQITTFGKAVGTYGAVILGKHLLKQYLINFSRPCIYTTAIPPICCIAIKCAYDLLPQMKTERDHIKSLIQIFNHNLEKASKTQIQAFNVEGNANVQRMSQNLAHHGYDVRPLMSPTVQRGNECLRICLHSFNTQDQAKDLLRICNESS